MITRIGIGLKYRESIENLSNEYTGMKSSLAWYVAGCEYIYSIV